MNELGNREHWSKQLSGGRVLTLVVFEATAPAPLWSAGPDDSDPVLGRGVIETVDGEPYQRYSSVEKARTVLAKRGFRRSEQLIHRPSTVDDDPGRAV